MIAGYLRVSTGKQHLANQKEEIIRYAAAKQITVDFWVTEMKATPSMTASTAKYCALPSAWSLKSKET